jgi:hypothetical protein
LRSVLGFKTAIGFECNAERTSVVDVAQRQSSTEPETRHASDDAALYVVARAAERGAHLDGRCRQRQHGRDVVERVVVDEHRSDIVDVDDYVNNDVADNDVAKDDARSC